MPHSARVRWVPPDRPRPLGVPRSPKEARGAYGGSRSRGGTKEWSRIFGKNLSRSRVSSDLMKYLRAVLLVIGIAGAILTMPSPSAFSSVWGFIFGAMFLACVGLTWFAWGLGKSKEVPESPQSTQAAPLQDQ